MPVFAENDLSKQKITPEITLKAIDIIEQNPLSTDVEGAISIVTNFTEQSAKVIVEINSKLLPWIERGISSEKANQLIGVFIAGNIKNQIITGIPKNNSYEGLVLVIKVYKIWRKENLIESIPELDKWSTFNNKELRDLINNNS